MMHSVYYKYVMYIVYIHIFNFLNVFFVLIIKQTYLRKHTLALKVYTGAELRGKTLCATRYQSPESPLNFKR